ncbi:MAG TPA: S41 family peptidase, partial [Chitinophaga sp.]
MPSFCRFHPILAVITLAVLISACRKTDQDAPPPTPTGPVTQQEINNWILDSMRYFYLWNQYLPSKADSQPAAVQFFNGLKYSADRFSLIYNPNDFSTYPTSMLYTYGIDFSVIDWPKAPAGAIGVIKLVIPGSPAAQMGLQRGNYFTRINGTALNSNNAAELSEKLLQASSGSFTLASVTSDNVTEDTTLTINAQILGEDPIYEHSSFNLSGKKVAYIFYNYCNDSYNQSLVSIFQSFKNAGATELILDLRYNPGGSVTAAALLAALIAPGINEQSVFARYSGNARLGQRAISFKSALSVPESGQAIAFSTLTPARLSLQRVFILAGAQTASAAELVINNLKPYTQVITIGQNTFGKDKGAVIISDLRTPQRIPWVLLPITYNLSNANGEGGYIQGLSIQYQVNEMSAQPLS